MWHTSRWSHCRCTSSVFRVVEVGIGADINDTINWTIGTHANGNCLDIFLSPIKPGNKDSTVESLKQALYYLHVSTPEDEGFVRQAMAEGGPELDSANATGPASQGAEGIAPITPLPEENQQASGEGAGNDHQKPASVRDPPTGRSPSIRSALSVTERQRLNCARRKPLPDDDSASINTKRSSVATPYGIPDRLNARPSLAHRRSASIGFALEPAASHKSDRGALDEPLEVLPPPPSAPAHKTGFFSPSSSSVESASSAVLPSKAIAPSQRSQATREPIVSGNEDWNPSGQDQPHHKTPAPILPYRPVVTGAKNDETHNNPPNHPLRPALPPRSSHSKESLPSQSKPISANTTVNFGSPYQPESSDRSPDRNSQDEPPKAPLPPMRPGQQSRDGSKAPTPPPLPPRQQPNMQQPQKCQPSPYVPNPFNLTLIRRDPVSGSQWNVGVINYPTALTGSAPTCENGHMHDVQDTSSIDLEILTPGYKRLLSSPAMLSSTVNGMSPADIAALPPAMREAVEKMAKSAGIKNAQPPSSTPQQRDSPPPQPQQQQDKRFTRRIKLVHRDANQGQHHHHHQRSHSQTYAGNGNGSGAANNSRPHRSLRESMGNLISNVFQTQIPAFGPAATVASGGIVGPDVPVPATPGRSSISNDTANDSNRNAQRSTTRTSSHRSRSPGLATSLNTAANSGPSWYTFSSPWGGMCAFMPSANGHSIKLRHAVPSQAASAYLGGPGGQGGNVWADGDQQSDHQHHPPPESVTATAAEIRFNLPFLSGTNVSAGSGYHNTHGSGHVPSTAQQPQQQQAKRTSPPYVPPDVTNSATATPVTTTVTQQSRKPMHPHQFQLHETAGSIAPASATIGAPAGPPPPPQPQSQSQSQSPLAAAAPHVVPDEREGRRRQRRRYSRPRSLSRASARLSALFSHSNSHDPATTTTTTTPTAAAAAAAENDGNVSDDRPASQVTDIGDDTTEQRQRQQPQPQPQEQTDTLHLAREKPGGGMRGRSAKLGKLVIEDDGLKMVDLVVSACMAVWWRGYESSVR